MNCKEERKPKKKRKSNFLYDFVKITGALPALIWMRPKVIYTGQGKPDLKGTLVCVNHGSFTDPVLLHCAFWYKRLHFLATTDLFQTKAKKFFFTQMHCIPVDKGNFNLNSVHTVRDELQEGRTLVIFPEGTVNREGEDELLAFKSGAPFMAYMANAPILPVYVKPTKKWYHRRVVVVGEPIDVRSVCKGPSMQAINEAGEVVRNEIIKLRNEYTKEKKS